MAVSTTLFCFIVISSTNLGNTFASCTCSLVTINDRILFFFMSTAKCIFRYPLLRLHLCLIHSPLFDTFIPVESIAITKKSSCCKLDL